MLVSTLLPRGKPDHLRLVARAYVQPGSWVGLKDYASNGESLVPLSPLWGPEFSYPRIKESFFSPEIG